MEFPLILPTLVRSGTGDLMVDDVVLTDQEIGRAEVGDRRAGLIQRADVHRTLDRLRTGRSRRHDAQRRHQHTAQRASYFHPFSIGPGFWQGQGNQRPNWFEICDLRQEPGEARKRPVS